MLGASLCDPLAEPQALALPEGTVAALARLKLVESLVGSLRASSKETFMLGPSHRGERQLHVKLREPDGGGAYQVRSSVFPMTSRPSIAACASAALASANV